MALTAALLANGQLPAAKGTLFTASSATIIKSITLVNTDASARTINLYIKRTTSRYITPVAYSLAAGASFIDDTVRTLSNGDLIEGDASAATVVDYTIAGAAA
jgi:hypothetical protein